jgi:hypothetical protein
MRWAVDKIMKFVVKLLMSPFIHLVNSGMQPSVGLNRGQNRVLMPKAYYHKVE